MLRPAMSLWRETSGAWRGAPRRGGECVSVLAGAPTTGAMSVRRNDAGPAASPSRRSPSALSSWRTALRTPNE